MNKFDSFLKEAKNIHLSGSEKKEIRAHLLALMSREPASERVHVRETMLIDHVRQWSKQAISLTRMFIKHHGMPVVVVLLVTLIAGGGVSYAAEGALPGTMLYPVKVHVNEEVYSAFSVTSERRGVWEAERLNRRLQEAEILAYRNEFAGDAKTEVESLIHLQSRKVRTLAAALLDRGEVSSASAVNTHFEIPLRVHEAVLNRLAISADEQQDEDIQSLALSLSAEKRQVEKVRADLESKEHMLLGSNRTAAIQGKLVSSAHTLANAQKAFSKADESFDDETIADVKMKLALIDKMRADGAQALEENDLERAFVSFQEAIRLGKEAKLLIESEKKIRAYAGVALFTDQESDSEQPQSSSTEPQEKNTKRQEKEQKNRPLLNARSTSTVDAAIKLK